MTQTSTFANSGGVNRSYLRGLDALRGIAALLVVVWHVLLVKQRLGLPSHARLENSPLVTQGPMAVTFFFVLSGFLITLLLLRERDSTGSISIRSFYFRRILRIWPVYYCCLLIGLCVPPFLQELSFPPPLFEMSANNLLWHGILFPNLAQSENPLCFQSWSIGVEEQFYLVWPWLFVYFCRTSKQMVATVACIVAAAMLCRFAHVVWPTPELHWLNATLARSRFDNMALGALFALAFHKNALPRAVWIAVVFWAIVVVLRLNLVRFPFGSDNLVYSLLFGFAIYYVSLLCGDRNLLEWTPLRFLGRISYGVYMYHVVAIYAVVNSMRRYAHEWPQDSVSSEVVTYASSVALTVALAVISYYGMEKRCLSWKSVIQSLASS